MSCCFGKDVCILVVAHIITYICGRRWSECGIRCRMCVCVSYGARILLSFSLVMTETLVGTFHLQARRVPMLPLPPLVIGVHCSFFEIDHLLSCVCTIFADGIVALITIIHYNSKSCKSIPAPPLNMSLTTSLYPCMLGV